MLSLSPAYPAFSLPFRPHPPDPLPLRGRGRLKVILCKGLRPLHPRGLNPGGTCLPSRCGARRGGVPRRCRFGGRWRHLEGGLLSLSPAYPAFSLPFRPHPPDPLPLRGRGRLKVILCKGLRPLHPRDLNPCGTCSPCRCGARRGGVPRRCRFGGRWRHPAGGAEPRRHLFDLPRGRGPSQTPKFLSLGPPSPWLPALLTSTAS